MKYAFQHDGKAFILKAEDGSTVRVGPRHKKYDYVQGVEAGRVIGISKSGRWTNATDYHDLYNKVSFAKAPSSTSKKSAAKPKSGSQPVPEAKPAAATKKPTSKPSSNEDAKRIQALKTQVAGLINESKDLRSKLKLAEAKVLRLQDELEEAAMREVQALLLADKMNKKSKSSATPKLRVKKKVLVTQYECHIQVKYKDLWDNWEFTKYTMMAEFPTYKDIKDYSRLTKGAIKAAIQGDHFHTPSWIGNWDVSGCRMLSMVKSGSSVQVSVLSMVEKDKREYAV